MVGTKWIIKHLLSYFRTLQCWNNCRTQFEIISNVFYSFFPFLGVPMEVMGLMLGEFVDEYTVRVIDVFAMPQSGTGVSVEAVDPVFQAKMLDMLKQTGKFTLNNFGKIGT